MYHHFTVEHVVPIRAAAPGGVPFRKRCVPDQGICSETVLLSRTFNNLGTEDS